MLSMASQTTRVFHDIIEGMSTDKEVLELQLSIQGQDAPTQAERAAIERVQGILKRAAKEIADEIPGG